MYNHSPWFLLLLFTWRGWVVVVEVLDPVDLDSGASLDHHGGFAHGGATARASRLATHLVRGHLGCAWCTATLQRVEQAGVGKRG